MPDISPVIAASIATAIVVVLLVFAGARTYLAAKRSEPDRLRKLTEKTFHEYERAVVRLNQEANASRARAEQAAMGLMMLQRQMGASVVVPGQDSGRPAGPPMT